MHEFAILRDLIVVFATAALVVALFHRLKIPAIVGLLVAGVLVGPYGLGAVGNAEEVSLIAELGVVVLLFTVGLEFSLSRLLAMWRVMLSVGGFQVLFCITVVSVAARLVLGNWGPAIFTGMLVAMSSTAVVLKLFTSRNEMPTPQGRLSVAVLLLQDLLVILFMILIPLLAPDGGEQQNILFALGKGIGMVALVLLGSHYAVRPVLSFVIKTRNAELFPIFVALLVLGTATLTASVGLSLALGAFLAGLILSESEYAHHVFSEILPFRDTLSSLFFVSVGMLLDIGFVLENIGRVTAIIVAVLFIKFLASSIPTLLVGYPIRIAVLTGASLLQIGEFSFVLADRGLEVGLINQTGFQTVLATAVLTMALTPLTIASSVRFSHLIPGRSGKPSKQLDPVDAEALRDHVIIIGFGLGGQNLAKVLKSVEIPYIILEMNPETVRRARNAGEPIHFGDGTRRAVLDHFGITTARLLTVVISDAAATRRVVSMARHLNPTIQIVTRTHYASETDELTAAGANDVIPENLLSAIEIFTRVLRAYQVPRNQILELVDRIQSGQYEVLRNLQPPKLNLLQQEIAAGANVQNCLIKDDSPAVGRSLNELSLRAKTGATLIAIRRNNQLKMNPSADDRFEAGDVAIILGDHAQVDAATLLLDPSMFLQPSE